jgi:DNA-binding NtrC family response regulator
MLQRAGYQTITAADGEEAVGVFEDNVDRVALALLDVVMPRLNGRDAFQRMIAIKPTLPAVFCSGYDPQMAHVGLATDEEMRLIQKPFDPQLLLATIREVLDLEPCQTTT